MATSKASRVLGAKLRGATRQGAREQSLIPGKEAEAGTELAQIAAGRIGLLAQEAPMAAGRSESTSDVRDYQPAGLLVRAEADEEFAPIRRGEDPQPATCDILTPMESLSPGTDIQSDTAASPDGISAFIARVLDQLTLSAWLPAALFTASLAVLLEFRSVGAVNIPEAVRALAANWVPVLILIIPVLIVATIVTQAFAFEAMRTLEGYWRRRGIASLARTLMIRRQVRRKNVINMRLDKAYEKAFYAARPRMIRDGVPGSVVNAFEADILHASLPSLTDEENEIFAETKAPWRSYCNPWHLAKVDHLLNDDEDYPDPTRIMPTRLGNLIRATEDELSTDGDLQGFVLRRHAMVPRRVQLQHDRFRTRLEMYCTLAFVSAFLFVLTPIILLPPGIGLAAVTVIAASFAALGEASYLAAIASARGYCAALKVMDDASEGLGTE